MVRSWPFALFVIGYPSCLVLLLLSCHLRLVVAQTTRNDEEHHKKEHRHEIDSVDEEHGLQQQPSSSHRRLASTTTDIHSWNGLPLVRHDWDTTSKPLLTSSVHCVGENYSPDAWMYRSCQFRNLCWRQQEFLVFESMEERQLREVLQARPDERTRNGNSPITISTLLLPSRSSVSLGTQRASEWFPTVIQADAALQQPTTKEIYYYSLPDSIALVPVSWDVDTTTSILWHVLYPIYTLLSLFELEQHQIVLVGIPNKKITPHVAEHIHPDMTTLQPYLSFMGNMLVDDWSEESSSAEMMICSKYAVAGLGFRNMFQPTSTYRSSSLLDTQSSAEGINLWAFRSYLTRNLGLPASSESTTRDRPIRVTVSTKGAASLDEVVAGVKSRFNSHQVLIQSIDLTSSDLAHQARIIANSHVWITALENHDIGMVTFLPRQSFLILFVDQYDEAQPANPPHGLHRKDWVLLHSAGYFQPHIVARRDEEGQSISDLLLGRIENIIKFLVAAQR